MPATVSLRIALVLVLGVVLQVEAKTPGPVNKNATPEARELLAYLYSISGKKLLSGQHNAPLNGSNRLVSMHTQVNAYPVVFGQDFGFSEPGSWDGINFRQNIGDEAIRRQNEGFVITFMWHAVLPLHNEPQTFQNSIQSKLSDEQWRELLSPGTDVVDVLAINAYSGRYNDDNYQHLLMQARGKPIALGEVENFPNPETLVKQHQ